MLPTLSELFHNVFFQRSLNQMPILQPFSKEVRMSDLTRWEPAHEMMTLREAMDRLFDDAFTHPVNGFGSSVPAIDLYQTNDSVVATAPLPRHKPQDVRLSTTKYCPTPRCRYKPVLQECNAT